MVLYHFICHYVVELSDDHIETLKHLRPYIDRGTSYMGERASKCMDHNNGSLRKGQEGQTKLRWERIFFGEKS